MTDATPQTSRTAIVVAGAHRSGTSALTRAINLLGAGISRNLLPATDTNETGHWEPWEVQALDDRLFAALGLSWDDWRRPSRAPGADEERALKGEALRILSEETPQDPFVIKDPRVCRLAGFWQEMFAAAGIADVYILPLRQPLEVAQSLARRDGMSVQNGLAIWARHVLDAELLTRGRQRAFCTYDELQGDWREMFGRFSRQTGLVLPLQDDPAAAAEVDAYVDPTHRHHRVADEPDPATWLDGLCQRVYTALSALLDSPDNRRRLAELDRLRAEFEAAVPDKPVEDVPGGQASSLLTEAVTRLSALRRASDPRRAGAEMQLLAAELQARHERAALDADPDALLRRIDTRLEEARSRYAALEAKFAALSRDREAARGQYAALEAKFAALDARLQAARGLFWPLLDGLETAGRRLGATAGRLERLEKPVRAFGLNAAARTLYGLARLGPLSDRRRARLRASAAKRDPREARAELDRISGDLTGLIAKLRAALPEG